MRVKGGLHSVVPRLLVSPLLEASRFDAPTLTNSGEVSRGEKIVLRGTDPESYITEYTSVYEDQTQHPEPQEFVGWGSGFGVWSEARD